MDDIDRNSYDFEVMSNDGDNSVLFNIAKFIWILFD